MWLCTKKSCYDMLSQQIKEAKEIFQGSAQTRRNSLMRIPFLWILSSAFFLEKCLFQWQYACYQHELLLLCSHRKEKIHRGGKWHTIILKFLGIQRTAALFATCDGLMFLLKPVAQNYFGLQWTSGCLWTDDCILAMGNNPVSKPLDSHCIVLHKHTYTMPVE